MRDIQYKGISVSRVKDPQLRVVLQELDDALRALFDLARGAFRIDTQRGTIKVVASVVLRDIGKDPSAQATYGEPGELVRDGDVVFKKIVTVGEDTNWESM